MLVQVLRPAIESEVALSFRRTARLAGRDSEQEVGDTTQEVFVCLLADNAKVLRSWDPRKGSGLRSFVRLVTRRRVASILRSGKKNPWQELPTPLGTVESMLNARACENRQLESADTLRKIVAAMAQRFGPRGIALFRMLYLEGRTIQEVRASTGMTRDALYAWRARLKRMAKQV